MTAAPRSKDRGIEAHGARPGDAAGQQISMSGPGSREILLAGNHQDRRLDAGQRRPKVHVADGRAASRVAHRTGCQERRANGLDRRAARSQQSRRKESLDHRLFDRGHAFCQHRRPPDFEQGGVGHPGRGVCQDQPLDAISRIRTQPLTDHSAKRQPAIREACNPRGIGHGQHIAPQLRDAVIAGRCVGCAVAAQIEAQHPEAAQQCRHLRTPHPVVRAQRMHQHQRRCSWRTFQPIVYAAAIGNGERHGYSFSSSRRSSSRRRRNASALPR